MTVLALALVGATVALLVVALWLAELVGAVRDLVGILDGERWPAYEYDEDAA